MRRFSLYFLVIVFLSACKEDENPTLAEFPQKWVFSGISSSWEANPVINPIADSLYYYELNENGTFTKFIGEFELHGNYETVADADNNPEYLVFRYDQETYLEDRERDGFGLIHYCGQDYEPFSFVDSNTIKGSWGACDGPNLYFERR
ncbi:hypothetical protein [uncultured Algoriphagus sp.]|jgi:hypothetical protein|uniref:hypothetical protein n=1 Tax=uncultured Algoriphagus sp. TaxID=417365 RepID=UPI00106649D5|nr:hypothetical protein [uncultured Algoriphagus sp.]